MEGQGTGSFFDNLLYSCAIQAECLHAASGVLTYILDRQVTLMDIKKWFYTPNSQKMKVSEEVSAPLRERGVTWPPNADGFAQCTCYRPNVKSPSESAPSIQFFTAAAMLACPILVMTSADVATLCQLHGWAELQALAPGALADAGSSRSLQGYFSVFFCANSCK